MNEFEWYEDLPLKLFNMFFLSGSLKQTMVLLVILASAAKGRLRTDIVTKSCPIPDRSAIVNLKI